VKLTAALLADRRRIRETAQARRRPARAPPAAVPRAAIAAYAQVVRRVLAALDTVALEALADVGVRVDADGGSGGLPRPFRGRILRWMTSLLRRLTSAPVLTRELDDVAAQTNTLSREQWQMQAKSALGIDLTADPNVSPMLTSFRDQGVGLIRSMGREKIARVRSILDDGAGDRVEDIAAKIREETQATPARANLIARDQVLKLNNGVTQARHVAAGVTEYVWRTSKDERVRSRHKTLEGTRQQYDTPPVVDLRTGRRAHPGFDYQCRCTAEPIIPRFE
jgi:SPP1 gp7 family putative phage head morphogenesis protein